MKGPSSLVVKTTEETIPLNSDELTIRLLEEMQIAFKPLTLEGLLESFIAALRDGRTLNYKKSLMGIVQTSLAHGPNPTLVSRVPRQDERLSGKK
ncbi:hypothetical protein QQ045_016210 [Rhodiola kirilowii]